MTKQYVGKRNGKTVFDKTKQHYYVYWFDETTGQRKTTSYAHWWWEINQGEIPDGYRASYIDGNPMNILPNNIHIISPNEFGDAISKRLMGHILSDETKRKIGAIHAGKTISDEHKIRIGLATAKMWRDGVFDKPEIREAYAKQGKATKGSKRTEEQKKKMSNAGKGKDITRLHTKEAIEKRRQKMIGKPKSIESNLKRSKTQKGRIFSEEHREKLSITNQNRQDLKGENSRWWKGGIANDPYPEEFSDYLKRKIRKRDKYLCQSCGENVYGSPRGHVHHIDGNKQNCSPDNLVLLCATCHNAVHGRNSITGDKIEYYKSKLE